MTEEEDIRASADYVRACDTRYALKEAWRVLPLGSPEQCTIACMLIQKGCEDFDEGCESLTKLCDIIMFG